MTLDKQTYHYKHLVAQKYGELVYDGLWFTQLKNALDAFVDSTQETVTGSVKLKLYKGNVMVAAIDTPYALYNQEISSFTTGSLYSHKDSAGFINLFGLPSKISAMVKNK